MTDDLKPCPLCGGRAILKTPDNFPSSAYYVICKDCLLETCDCFDKDRAIVNWNTRF